MPHSSIAREAFTLSTSCLALFALPHESAAAQGCTTVRASVATDGSEGISGIGQFDLSADGRYVVFTTASSNIVPGGTQVAGRHLVTGETTLLSAGPGGVPSNGGVNEHPRLSADGVWVVWSSRASNLVAGDTNNLRDIYLREIPSGNTFLASRSTGGPIGNGNCFEASVSGDGRHVAFDSASTNLVPGDVNASSDVFVFDRDTGTIEIVSVTASGMQGDLFSSRASISADGRFVAFTSGATTFHPADVNALPDVFVKDRQTGALSLVSARPEGIPGNGNSTYPSISANGLFVAFQSTSTDFGPPDHPVFTTTNVFVRDLAAGTTSVIDVDVLGGPPMNQAEHPDLSADGRFVAFESSHVDLVIGDTNAALDVFVHDRLRNETRRANLTNADLQTAGFSGRPAISDDGERVGFQSGGALVDDDSNGVIDVYVRTCPIGIGSAYCSGDGSATPCPCANAGALGSGCGNPVHFFGGRLFAIGDASASADTLVLRGEGLPTSFITYFQGTQQVNGGQGIVFGDGLLCAGGGVIRLGTKFSAGGVSGYPAAGDLSIAEKGQIPAGGGVTRTYQGWYRSAVDFCTSDTFNLTNGVEISWQP